MKLKLLIFLIALNCLTLTITRHLRTHVKNAQKPNSLRVSVSNSKGSIYNEEVFIKKNVLVTSSTIIVKYAQDFANYNKMQSFKFNQGTYLFNHDPDGIVINPTYLTKKYRSTTYKATRIEVSINIPADDENTVITFRLPTAQLLEIEDLLKSSKIKKIEI